MWKAKLELVPYGIDKLKKEIYEIEIHNDGSGNFDYGNYKCKIIDKENDIIMEASVKKFKRENGVFELFKKAFEECSKRYKNAKENNS